MTQKLASASVYAEPATVPLLRFPGVNPVLSPQPTTYAEEVRQCRHFYLTDPLASSVINRMVSLATTKAVNIFPSSASSIERAVFNDALAKIQPLLPQIFTVYLVDGMVIVDHGLTRSMANRLDPSLGRTRYTVLESVWVRNNDTIKLKRIPASSRYQVLVTVPPDEYHLIVHKGLLPDGRDYRDVYEQLRQAFPEYVALVQKGLTEIPLDVVPILRKMVPFRDYPQPFLLPALSALKHKARITLLDQHLATRAVEAIRHVKVGNDAFPVTDGDTSIEDLKQQLQQKAGNAESVYTLITNHTVDISWVYPPLDALLSDRKYDEPNNTILMAFGFSRVLLVGEALRSNSGAGASPLGSIAAIDEMRFDVTTWITSVYEKLAASNGFSTIPTVRFRPIVYRDYIDFVRLLSDLVRDRSVPAPSLYDYLAVDSQQEPESRSEPESEFGLPNNTNPVQGRTQDRTQDRTQNRA